jgi:hypothetical protein
MCGAQFGNKKNLGRLPANLPERKGCPGLAFMTGRKDINYHSCRTKLFFLYI